MTVLFVNHFLVLAHVKVLARVIALAALWFYLLTLSMVLADVMVLVRVILLAALWYYLLTLFWC